MQNIKKPNFLVCPECQGVGYIEDKPCRHCRAFGVALHFRDKILYWGKYYDSAHNIFEKAAKRFKIFFNLALGVVGLSGIILLAYVGYLDNFKNFFSIQYWTTPSADKLYFWITLLVDLYLYYRLEQENSAKYSVMYKKFQSDGAINSGAMDWPTVWQLKKDDLVDISHAFTLEAENAVRASVELARHFGFEQARRIHLFGVLTNFDKSAIIMARLGVDFEDFKDKISRTLAKSKKDTMAQAQNPVVSAELHEILLLAYLNAYFNDNDKVDTTELVEAVATPELLSENIYNRDVDDANEILIDFGLTYQKMKNAVAWIRIQEQLRAGLARFRSRAKFKPKSGMDRAMTAVATPILDQFSEDLTLAAKFGRLFPCIGRETEMENIFRIMEGSRAGVLLIGNQGVGRSSIIQGLAERMAVEDVPPILRDKRLVSLNVSRLIAGADASSAEQRLLEITDEIIQSGNIVLGVENLHQLAGITAGNENSLDLSGVFAEILSRHYFYCIATTAPLEYSKELEESELGAAFQPIKVEELELNDAICVLEVKSGPIEYQNQIYFSYDAIEKAAILSNRYIHDRYLPEKAIEIMERTAIKVKKENPDKKIISGEDVAAMVSEMTKIPVASVTEKESEKLLNLEDRIHERLVDQEEAVSIVAASLRRARAELRESKRPIASLLFLGPTGVGKTELAKTIAEVYFHNEKNIIRLDMSEYQEQGSINRIIGAGSNAGQLTETVRKNPFSLVLFDEVEKAHPDILNLFLQMMDDGRLTDNQGRTVDFTNTIIIMTSNAGAEYIQTEIKNGAPVEQIKNFLVNEELKKNFRPEFLNRLDGIVVFKPLTLVDVIKIARIMIDKITKRLGDKGISFKATDEAIAELAEFGYDPKFGARPLRRTIEQRVDDILANYLLKGDLQRRDKVTLEAGGKIKIEKAEKI
ncbi:MAG: AAA family ATPase [Parcubacteria group bacterium]